MNFTPSKYTEIMEISKNLCGLFIEYTDVYFTTVQAALDEINLRLRREVHS